MTERHLPPTDEMYAAVLARDTRYEGIFVTAVKTTGIFCRPSCPARKPKRDNVEFHASAKEALAHGYRPCLRCHPLEPRGQTPAAIRTLLRELDTDSAARLSDRDLRARGMEPATLRRWFRKHHGMTFHAYHRARRLARAIGRTRSYSEQAHAMGAPTAVRAVARANGDNRIAIVIPCHRVVGANGKLTGYGGGLWRKRWLLHHEEAVRGDVRV